MKLKNVILGVALLVASMSFGQEKGGMSFYVGGVYNVDPGTEVGFSYGITDKIDAVASFAYYFSKNLTRYNINLDARYYISDNGSLKFYGLVGVSRYTYSVPASTVLGTTIKKSTASLTGFNIGGGILYPLSENMDLIAQAKYGSAATAFEPMVGISFKF